MKHKILRKATILNYVKSILPDIVRATIKTEENILSLNLKWKNFPRTIEQDIVLLHHFSSKERLLQEEYELLFSRIKKNVKDALIEFGKTDCDYLMDSFNLDTVYRNEFEDKNIMYKVQHDFKRKVGNGSVTRNLSFYYYDEIKLSLPSLYYFWILLIDRKFIHINFEQMMHMTDSLIVHLKQLFFTKDIIDNIIKETKHFGNPDSFFVFYYHFTNFVSLIKTIGDNLAWVLVLYLKLGLRHLQIDLTNPIFHKLITKNKHYYNTLYSNNYFDEYKKIDEFRNVIQHRHIIRAMRVLIKTTMENKILVPRDPEVQMSKALKISKRRPNKQHVMLAENRDSTIMYGAHDYTAIAPSDVSDYVDPLQFCMNNINGISMLVENTFNRIVSELTRKEVGKVMHFYPKKSVAMINLTHGLKVGSHILLEGNTTSFEQDVTEMQKNHTMIQELEKGLVGLKINSIARPKDKVYLIEKIDKARFIQHLFTPKHR
jgi:hypothetical protein